ncbi:holo-ACP synthase [Streptobacillus moniliformis]|uniref:Holo-[acyl-carrier-protein] synthase n=1 Tax=Streptobacillus moniliformis (strain ATCC 14647 / DSM 12112 / NCTC 10651 / 9901) TaxID=519441 RepID=D1AXM1_STRM9|nr:holo-ACP synthase [Streptobacillus moniliformis]ACZ01047.1 holo-acyl-carrier-protein synthase [Streptobacillus moniliformis DSM 12112]AVL42584.1 holo-[acyl-carrier-protein] synthase [Streptobacillus moniliformis]QXW65825.1 holo-ACP synthase [Streptobacillus moniliformis]SQA13813.1 Holo-[acyl-carrier-protein] synthase [Streptobacillus moniliformis]
MFKIGIDIVDVKRIEKAIIKSEHFLKNVFSQKEIEYCEKKINKYESYAARFAAKEAYIKAIGTGITDISLNNIEIINSELGKPFLYVNGELIDGDISLSHTESLAIANIILKK